MFFGSEYVLPGYGFLPTNFRTVTNSNDYIKFDLDDDDDDFRYNCRAILIAQIKQHFYNKNFSLQDQSKCDENDTLQKINKLWPNVIDIWGPMPFSVYNYDYNDGMDSFVRGADILPEIRALKILIDIPRQKCLRNQLKFY